jgi:transcriptional regulator of heat shock response
MQQIPIKIKNGPTGRQKLVLKNLIEDYIENGQPVSSAKISKINHLEISPATIRIELSNLENQNLIYHPYTSAGCLPTDLGLRYFIDYIIDNTEMDLGDFKAISNKLSHLTNEYNKLIRAAVKILSENYDCISLGTLPNGDIFYSGIANLFKNIDSNFFDKTVEVVDTIDNFDQHINLLVEELEDYKIFIGQENPIDQMKQHSMIIAGYELQNWGKGIIGIIGSKRMPYQRIKSSMLYLSDFISGRLGEKY